MNFLLQYIKIKFLIYMIVELITRVNVYSIDMIDLISKKIIQFE